MADSKQVKLQVPPENPFNEQAVKRYIFNETGNIMLASTELNGEQVPESVRDVFSEVAVFFAAMTKAISTTINPDTKKPYSLYNYEALQNVIDGSGLFIHVTEEDIVHKTQSFGMSFSKELIEGLLGLATGAGALSFAQGMISSMGNAGLKIGESSSSDKSKVANIIFVCEYLLGMPVVSAMVVYCDMKTNKQAFNIGPCFKESSTSTQLTMHKDTYMFVTPKFIKTYSGDLESVTTDQDYLEFVDYLQALVLGTPIITAVQVLGESNDEPAPSELTVGKTYVILGTYLNNKGDSSNVKVAWLGPNNTTPGAAVKNAQVQNNIISFSPTANTTPTAIGVYFSDGGATPKWKLAVATPSVYTTKSTATISLAPSPVSMSKTSTGPTATKKVTATLANATGLTLDGMTGQATINGTGATSALKVSANTANSVNAVYTKPTTPAVASATVSVTFKTKKTSGGAAGPDVTATFDFDIT